MGNHERNGRTGWMSRMLLLAALGGMACLAAGCRHKTGPAAPRASDAGVATANAVLRASEADVGMLKNLSGRLEKACSRNKYGLTEQECLVRLRDREDGCADSTAARFPGRLEDTGRMQVVVQAYVGCIFEN